MPLAWPTVHRARSLAWGFGLIGLVAAAAYVLSGSALVKAVVICSLSAAAAAVTVVGVVVHRPPRVLPWLLVASMQLAWAVAWIFWQERILSTGLPPASDSLVNVGFLVGYPLLAAALVILLLQREPNRVGVIDAAVLTGAIFVVAWAALLRDYLGAGLPHGGVTAQLAYGFCDIVLTAIVLRLLVTPGSHPPAFVFVLVGTALLTSSDFAWNWLTRFHSYVPGAWADLGWVLAPVALGLAALSPSMAGLFEPAAPRPRQMKLGLLGLMLVAVVVGPIEILLDVIDRDATLQQTSPHVVAALLLSVLVVVRLGVNAAEQGRLSDEVGERSRRLADLARIVESTSDAVIAAATDREITAWNRAAEQLFGYTADEAIGRSIGILAPGDLEAEQVAYRDRLLAGEEMAAYETTRRHKDGRLLDVSVTLSALRDERDEVVGFSSIIRDIGKRKLLDAEREAVRVRLVEQNNRLRELDRLKDDFVASVSHELRTPLTSIRGYLELVLDGEAGELTAEQSNFLEIVERNADRLLQLVGDLLFVAQVGAGSIRLQPGSCDLDDLARNAVEAVRPLAQKRDVELELSTAELGELVADRDRLAQVFDNLVSNAVKFTPPGGRVAVRSFAAGDGVVIEVADTGMGIAEEDQARLFERFFRTAAASERAIQGTGLGLAIVKAIVEAHGGSISVSSTLGVGTTFRVELPWVRAEVAA